MLTPKFTLPKTERVYLTDKYFCNGHWLLKRDQIPPHFKAFAPLRNLKNGAYVDGYANESNDNLPDIEAVIPQREGYTLLSPQPSGCHFAFETTVSAYTYLTVDFETQFEVAVDPKYVPLMQLGHCFAKNPTAPILILSGNTLNDDLVGVLMPRRN